MQVCYVVTVPHSLKLWEHAMRDVLQTMHLRVLCYFAVRFAVSMAWEKENSAATGFTKATNFVRKLPEQGHCQARKSVNRFV